MSYYAIASDAASNFLSLLYQLLYTASPVLSAVLSLLCQLLNRLSCHCCVSCYIACPFSCLITVASAGLYNSTVTVASAVVLPILSAFLLIVLQRKLLIPMNPYRTFLYISLQNNVQGKYFVTY